MPLLDLRAIVQALDLSPVSPDAARGADSGARAQAAEIQALSPVSPIVPGVPSEKAANGKGEGLDRAGGGGAADSLRAAEERLEARALAMLDERPAAERAVVAGDPIGERVPVVVALRGRAVVHFSIAHERFDALRLLELVEQHA